MAAGQPANICRAQEATPIRTHDKPAKPALSPQERRSVGALAAIYATRMLGLFLILPVFSVYAKTLPGGDDLALVGFALGAYGGSG